MDEALIRLAGDAGVALQARGWRLCLAESCTGGLVAAAVTEIAGSSGWFERGFVTYSNEAKMELLGVSAATLERHGAVSEACVHEMALGALSRSHADVAVAISGIAGPGGGTPQKPVGTVCIAWASLIGTVRVATFVFEGARRDVRVQAVQCALEGMLALVSPANPADLEMM